MANNAYPELAVHQIEHKKLTDKVLAFKNDFDKGTASVTPALMRFLEDWLTSHISTVDKKYGEFLNAHGVH